jgi:hypothetical protein
MKRLTFAFVLFTTLGASSFAHAGNVEQCLSAEENGERFKKQGRLVEARQNFATCARESCPGKVRDLCRKYAGEVDEILPTIVVTARDGENKELAGVKISVDGVDVTPGADGTLAVDPGARTVRVVRNGESRQKLVEVVAGNKRTPVVLIFEAPPPPPKAPPLALAPTPQPVASPRENGGSSGPVWPWIVGGIGVASLATSGVFGLKWMSDSKCSPSCSPDEVDRVRTGAIVTDVFLGVGIVALGIATIGFLTSSSSTERAAPASARR